MPYLIPDDLRELAVFFKQEYKEGNPQRLSFITLLNLITLRIFPEDKHADEDLLSANIFEYEFIYQSYDKKYLFLSPFRSQMFCLLHKKLNFSETNFLQNDLRLYYLNKFYQYVQKNISDEEMVLLHQENPKKFIWKTKTDLLNDIHFTLKNLMKRDLNRIEQVMYATPDLITLRKGFKTLHSLYQEARKKRYPWMQNPEREELLNLIDLIDETFYFLYPESESEHIKRLQGLEVTARRAFIIFILLDIDYASPLPKWIHSAQGSYFSPGSELYKKGLNLLNLNDINQWTHDQKINLLYAALSHLNEVQNDNSYFETLQNLWNEKGFSHLEKAFEKLRKRINFLKWKEEELAANLSSKEMIVQKAGAYSTQYFFSYLFRERALVGLSTMLAAQFGGTLAGVAVYASGTLVLAGLAPLLNESLFPIVSIRLFGWLLEKIGTTIGGMASDYVSYRFTPTIAGIDELRSRLSPEEQKNFKRWINTLLVLPEDVLSEKEKNHIRYILNIENRCKFKLFNKEAMGTSVQKQNCSILDSSQNDSKDVSLLRLSC